jgi:hypothetical protein
MTISIPIPPPGAGETLRSARFRGGGGPAASTHVLYWPTAPENNGVARMISVT